jgi:DNA repair ATPase RecN
MGRLTNAERSLVKSLVANLSLKRFPEKDILKEIERHTGKSFSRNSLFKIKQSIKKDSYDWYKSMRETQYDYLHEFKSRINEIIELQRQHHKIIADNPKNMAAIQTSLAELHRLNITLSNYFEVAPSIIEGVAYAPSNSSINKKDNHDSLSASSQQSKEIIV